MFLTLTFSGCYYDNEEDLYVGSNNCDTTNVTYSGSVVTIFADNCNSCHSGSTPSGNITTDTYDAVKLHIANIRASINFEPGHIRMPNNGSKLSNCQLSTIDAWINHGMPKN